jgi:tetratricopeptide (TPR) repeat protein
LPEEVTGDELAPETRVQLRPLPKDLATLVARHMVMAGRLIEEDPETAYRHAESARRFAARIGVVREACGLAAYHSGRWSDALNELRAARRLSGHEGYLPVMADCERGLGRPERALELAKSDEARRLEPEERIEMRIVEAGARRDMGQPGAAIIALQVPELEDRRLRPWSARLFYAYADALAEEGREREASEWFARAAAADRDGETDAAERYAGLEGLEIVDVSGADPFVVEPEADGSAETSLGDAAQPDDAADKADAESSDGTHESDESDTHDVTNGDSGAGHDDAASPADTAGAEVPEPEPPDAASAEAEPREPE